MLINDCFQPWEENIVSMPQCAIRLHRWLYSLTTESVRQLWGGRESRVKQNARLNATIIISKVNVMALSVASVAC